MKELELKEINTTITLPRDVNRIPIDGTLYETNLYLEQMSKDLYSCNYIDYLELLRYFTGLYALKGDKEITKLGIDIIRHAIEFGKVALTRFRGRLLAVAIVEVKTNIYGDIVKISGIPIRRGYGYTEQLQKIDCKPEETVILKNNHLSLPLIYFWREALNDLEKLYKAAMTASIASIKKFKRNIYNNSSIISRLEAESMMNPETPYIENIASAQGFTGLLDADADQSKYIRQKYDVSNTTAPNSIEMNTATSDAENNWKNLELASHYICFKKGKRINTNKKNERNVSSEIATETINFDILDQEFLKYLKIFVDECKEKLNIDIEVEYFIEKQGELNEENTNETLEMNTTISNKKPERNV